MSIGIGIILDLILIIVIVFSVIMGMKKGFVQTILEIAAILVLVPISIVISWQISSMFAEKIAVSAELEQKVYQLVENNKGSIISEDSKTEKDKKKNSNFLENIVNNTIKENKEKTTKEITSIVIKHVVLLGVRAVITMITFALLYIIFIVLTKVFSGIIDSIPLINNINYIAGGILAFIKIMILVLIILSVVRIVNIKNINGENTSNKMIDETIIVKVLYENNVLNRFIK